MIILFSPSEGKKTGGDMLTCKEGTFLFDNLHVKRLEVLEKYNSIVTSKDEEAIKKLYGIKDPKKFTNFDKDIYSLPTMKVIERYDGVAFDYLDYNSLHVEEKTYIDNSVIIFSNLFGPVRAGDCGLPEYKLKQGESLEGFKPEAFYKEHFSKHLDDLINDEPFLDLRAGFYNKFYKPKGEYTTLKFLKEGKVVSHWAKAYRGLVLRALAKEGVSDMDAFMTLEIEGLHVKEIKKVKNNTEIVFEILST